MILDNGRDMLIRLPLAREAEPVSPATRAREYRDAPEAGTLLAIPVYLLYELGIIMSRAFVRKPEEADAVSES